ncbi:hypothetical protein LY78DRAFT_685913 [Colletotrichum sublineola]|nr:hypothetical protein LY78DRAFT_685913 [Colletotrichum sublineola]
MRPRSPPLAANGNETFLIGKGRAAISTASASGQGDDQAAFHAALGGLRENNPMQPYWRMLVSRIQSSLPLDEVKKLNDAPRIYGTNAEVREFNTTHLERLDAPVVNCKAIDTGPGAEAVDSKDAGSLHNSLTLCRGARVMLTENLWTAAGLVNDARHIQPFVVLVKMDKYSGPACFYGELSQDIGATLDRTVLNIAAKQFAAGLTYVAVLRVKMLEGLMVEEPFSLADLKVAKDNTGLRRTKDYLRRRDAGEILDSRPRLQ